VIITRFSDPATDLQSLKLT